MSEAYQQKEWELNSLIDNLSSIEYTYEEYKKEVDYFIDRLLEDTKEINILRNENKRLHSIIEEVREYIENNDIMKVSKEENTKGAIFCDTGILEILDKDSDKE